MSEDQRLLQRLHRGDRDALRCIYEQYSSVLLTIAVSVLCDIHAAEDCLHDVFVSFARAAGDLHIKRSLKGYLITCTLNSARDQLRRRRNSTIGAVIEPDIPATSGNPVKQLIDNEESDRVFRALGKLPGQQHEVVAMRLYGEMKFKEIAKMLGISINTAQSRYRYGIEKLRSLL